METEILISREQLALSYVRRGWSLVPLRGKTKIPAPKAWQNLPRTTKEEAIQYARSGNNIGIRTGAISGIIVVDVDKKHNGIENAKALKFPRTPMVRTGSGGYHLYYKYPEGGLGNSTGTLPPGIDIRGDGGQVVAPPGIHPDTGKEYKTEIHPDDCPIAELPKDILAMVRTTAPKLNGRSIPSDLLPLTERIKRASSYLSRIPGAESGKGGHDATYKAALAMLKGFSLSHDVTLDLMLRNFNPRCIPHWSEKEIRHKVSDAAKATIPDGYLLCDSTYSPTNNEVPNKTEAPSIDETNAHSKENITQEPLSFLPRTDLGNSERLVSRHGDDLRFCHKWNSWFAWDGRHWVKAESGEVLRKAKETVRAIYDEAKHAPDDDRPKIAKHAIRSESEARLKAMISLAESDEKVIINTTQLDSDPWLFNVQNGTVDLKMGILREHRREDMITKISPVTFDSNATCDVWEDFLSEIFDGKDELVTFMWKALGYALTGLTTEQCLFLFYGTGSNGKTTLIELIIFILSNYAKRADFSTFLVGDPNKIRNDVARLVGARFISASEAESGQCLSESLVKQLTAGDTVTARFLHQEHFEFQPEFKLFLGANHKPVIKGTDHAIWRRIRLVPFTVTIPDEKQDKDLFRKLKDEAPGILAWMVQGCIAWQKEGLTPPETVRSATENYRIDMDTLADFLLDKCVEDRHVDAPFKDLYKAYNEWCDQNGEKRPLGQRSFGSSLEERGFPPAKRGSNRVRIGIKLRGLGL
jgi:putative DNA primase/helicase